MGKNWWEFQRGKGQPWGESVPEAGVQTGVGSGTRTQRVITPTATALRAPWKAAAGALLFVGEIPWGH